jgi:hypothetical protein
MASALQALKTRLRNRTVDLERRLRLGDFSPQIRRKVVDDPEALRLRTELEKVKDKWESGLIMDRLKKRGVPEKVANKIVALARAFKLTSPVVFGKLTSAAAVRLAQNPTEEIIGSAIARVLPGIAEQSPRHGMVNINAEAKSITDAFTKGMADAWQVLTTGKSELDLLYGKHIALPWEWMGVFGQMHGSLKAPVKRAEFARSFEKRIAWNMKKGVDVTSSVEQMRIGMEAYQDANRSIFMNDNAVTDLYKIAINMMDRSQKHPVAGKALANAARFFMPIVKVPTNIVGETMEMNPVYGGAKILVLGLTKGMKDMAPEDADMVMRVLKKGAIGSALMFYGYTHPEEFGGYYQPGEKRKTGDVKAAHVKLFGYDMPAWSTHGPVWETFQIGATVRRVADSMSKGHRQGIRLGTEAAALGVIKEVPFVDQPIRMAEAFRGPSSLESFAGATIGGAAIPAAVSRAAQWTDNDANGNPIQRKPIGFTQNIEVGIPGLRENVPAKRNKFSIRGQ